MTDPSNIPIRWLLRKYDAIIVDEAQDFREKWWAVVEAGLEPEGFFYIFHDDNQSLLPTKGYPNIGPLIDLSKNCRNAQRVFELMRCFARTLPEARLSGGKVTLRSYFPGDERKALSSVFREMHMQGLIEKTVVIWAGAESVDKSPIAIARSPFLSRARGNQKLKGNSKRSYISMILAA